MPNNNDDTIIVLLIEDSKADAGLIQAHLAGRSAPSFVVHHSTRLADGLRCLRESVIDIIVLDLSLPDSDGLESFFAIKQASHGIPTVILSGIKDDHVALQAVRQGAQDFFSKSEAISSSLGLSLQYAIERFHRQQAEREIDSAAYIQHRLFPRPLSPLKRLAVAGRCDPANQVGGDYYDYFMADATHLLLVIGDVSGHGFGPALVMAETRAALRTMATTTDDIGTIIERVNELLFDDEFNSFVSLFVARIDIKTGVCAHASAGQPAELIRSDGSFETLASESPPLGIHAGIKFAVYKTQLRLSDTILLYTDGISERSPAAGEFYGVSRIRELVARSGTLTAAETIERIFSEANDFAEGRPAVDDTTAVVLKVIAAFEDTSTEAALPSNAELQSQANETHG